MRFLALLDLFRIVRGTLKIITSRKLFHIVFNHFPQFFEKIYQNMQFLVKKVVSAMTEYNPLCLYQLAINSAAAITLS